MNNIVLDKKNFGNGINKLYDLIVKGGKTVVINNSNLISGSKFDLKDIGFLKLNKIKITQNPLDFQKSIRDEW